MSRSLWALLMAVEPSVPSDTDDEPAELTWPRPATIFLALAAEPPETTAALVEFVFAVVAVRRMWPAV